MRDQVIFDVQRTGRRYTNDADKQLESMFLGLAPDATNVEIANELQRRGLDDFSYGRVVRGGKA